MCQAELHSQLITTEKEVVLWNRKPSVPLATSSHQFMVRIIYAHQVLKPLVLEV